MLIFNKFYEYYVKKEQVLQQVLHKFYEFYAQAIFRVPSADVRALTQWPEQRRAPRTLRPRAEKTLQVEYDQSLRANVCINQCEIVRRCPHPQIQC